MAITPAMLAQTLLKYFAIEQHSKELEDLLLKLHKIDDGYVTWSGDKLNDRITLTVTKEAHAGDGIVAEYVYNIKIERE
jgi:hypothetical protein